MPGIQGGRCRDHSRLCRNRRSDHLGCVGRIDAVRARQGALTSITVPIALVLFEIMNRKGGKMDVQALIIWLIVGAIAGWLAGMLVKGSGYGLIGDIVVGILGGLIAGWLLPQLGIAIGGGFIAAIIDAFIGAVILLIALRLIRRVA